MKAFFKLSAVMLFFCILVLYFFIVYFGPPGTSDKEVIFIVPKRSEGFDRVSALKEKGLIKHEGAFRFVMDNYAKVTKVEPGGYRLHKKMNAFQIAKKIGGVPDLLWVTVGACLRKEQIGEILAGTLGWEKGELDKWNTVYTNIMPEYFEGVYYPDTYLIPRDEPGDKIAKRFINRFNEKFEPYYDRYVAANIRWVTGLKIASLIAREAAGKQDMKLISGIIWNRLDIGMPLQIDATMQYTAGKRDDGSWWGSIDIDEKQKDSPYNSYLYKGLPPTPICSPNIDYIVAALEPDETSCLFYLHDRNGQIHCSDNFEEHLEKIDIYL